MKYSTYFKNFITGMYTKIVKYKHGISYVISMEQNVKNLFIQNDRCNLVEINDGILPENETRILEIKINIKITYKEIARPTFLFPKLYNRIKAKIK